MCHEFYLKKIALLYFSERLILQVPAGVADKYINHNERVRRLISEHECINCPHSTVGKEKLLVAAAEEFSSETLSPKPDANIFGYINHLSLTLTHSEPQYSVIDTTRLRTITT